MRHQPTNTQTSHQTSIPGRIMRGGGMLLFALANLLPGPRALQATQAPAIILQPVNVSIRPDTNAFMNVYVSGSAPLSYFWFFNGTNARSTLDTAVTTDSWPINADANSAGNYFVVITNAAGASTSRVVTLSLTNSTTNAGPTIFKSPVDTVASAGTNVTLSVVAGGNFPVLYQWYFSPDTNTPATAIPGAAKPTCTITNAQTSSSGIYHVVAFNAYGSVPSGTARITVVPTGAPTIVGQSVSLTTNAYVRASFSVSAAGTPPLSYQWRVNGTNLGVNSSVLAFANVKPTNAGDYYAIVSNAAGSATSSVATLSVFYTVASNPAQLSLLSHSTTVGDRVRGQVEIGKNYTIQTSADMMHWGDFTNFLAKATVMDFDNRSATNNPGLFYRIVSP